MNDILERARRTAADSAADLDELVALIGELAAARKDVDEVTRLVRARVAEEMRALGLAEHIAGAWAVRYVPGGEYEGFDTRRLWAFVRANGLDEQLRAAGAIVTRRRADAVRVTPACAGEE